MATGFEVNDSRSEVVAIATELVGSDCIRYVPGHPELGQSKDGGFDCSGFVSYVLRESGLIIPDYISHTGEVRPIRHTNEFFDHYGIAIHKQFALPGDLIFFSKHGWTPSHIGLMISPNHFVHAPGHDGEKVLIESIESIAITPKSKNGHRIIYDHNPIGFKSLVIPHDDPSYRVHQRAL